MQKNGGWPVEIAGPVQHVSLRYSDQVTGAGQGTSEGAVIKGISCDIACHPVVDSAI